MKRALNYGVLLFVFALPFGAKKFITPLIPQLFEYAREFSSLFLYATDILAIVLVVLAVAYGGRRVLRMPHRGWYAALAACALCSLVFTLNVFYSLYVAANFLLALAVAVTIAFVVRERIVSVRDVFIALGASAVVQAVISILQFYYQKSVGLWFLGEPVVTAATKGVARVEIGDLRFLRAFGTLPHANILAGFLVMGLIACAYLYLTASKERILARIVSVVSLFAILVALVFSFSRSGWIAAAISMMLIFAYAFWNKELRVAAVKLVCAALVSLVMLSVTLGWAIMPRAGFAKGEPSVDHRMYYNEIGLTLVREHPLGVGLGNEVLQAEQEGLFAVKGLKEAWLWQPVHNIYILIASELGIAGFVIFLALLFFVFRGVSFASPESVFAALLVVSLLLFGLVDHFPWDLHAGRLMFFAALGILLSFRPIRPVRQAQGWQAQDR